MCTLVGVPTISMTDAGCHVIYDAYIWTGEVVAAILGSIKKGTDISRVIRLAIAIANAVISVIMMIHTSGGVIGDCFTVLIQTHVSYFASFLAVSCFEISLLSLTLSADTYSLDTQINFGLSQIFQFVQLFVLGPRLILSVREYHAELVANSDRASAMTSIAFQEHVHVSTSSRSGRICFYLFKVLLWYLLMMIKSFE
ncbi:hypothetical protein DFJ58DRAFT_844434 [Suillus subalutaceus]|uniref:uncharacterized protein n=1 Tax=Suillus subalutaceus TaxID=48586 RepID=UPI001B86738C|nr:uncharacterized protein DFJ58DRAFT_844434 [Suillus subalutaceus]KAG1843123.1 hypothetical protein DFJ58DRAFT_844434 [Suillus subalutaceus]